MRTVLIAVAMSTIAATASAEPPAGADEIHGAFGRMLTHEATPLAPARESAGSAGEVQFEQWVNAATRGEMTSLERGFVKMIERTDDVPATLTVSGTADVVAVMVATALRAQAEASVTERRAAL